MMSSLCKMTMCKPRVKRMKKVKQIVSLLVENSGIKLTVVYDDDLRQWCHSLVSLSLNTQPAGPLSRWSVRLRQSSVTPLVVVTVMAISTTTDMVGRTVATSVSFSSPLCWPRSCDLVFAATHLKAVLLAGLDDIESSRPRCGVIAAVAIRELKDHRVLGEVELLTFVQCIVAAESVEWHVVRSPPKVVTPAVSSHGWYRPPRRLMSRSPRHNDMITWRKRRPVMQYRKKLMEWLTKTSWLLTPLATCSPPTTR